MAHEVLGYSDPRTTQHRSAMEACVPAPPTPLVQGVINEIANMCGTAGEVLDRLRSMNDRVLGSRPTNGKADSQKIAANCLSSDLAGHINSLRARLIDINEEVIRATNEIA